MKDERTAKGDQAINGAQAKKEKKIMLKRTDPYEALKLEIAAELGLIEQVRDRGWHSLSAKDAGKIGGIMTQRKKKERRGE
ncbi:small, acid-soluble spore protein, alpha/beta type [Desulfitobacterium sp.]|uniref:small, acid-soluble spore protein, alpha/beta type n=1 Tax=Desulfitobacterium sp. TaxID=49981 RepID=UPI0039C8B8B4